MHRAGSARGEIRLASHPETSGTVILHADARHLPLKDESVQMCVTSPPYYGLRDYGVPGQIGLEPTPMQYVMQLVQVFGEVYRVLKPGGTLWLNLGDSYTNAGGADRRMSLKSTIGRANGGKGEVLHHAPSASFSLPARHIHEGAKPKDLLGIPWRVAFALQHAGWYLRSDIIWHKPNPMPESVTDRPTKAHEYLFLLAKSERYFYDSQAIAEPVSAAMFQEMEQGYEGLGLKDYDAAGVQNPSSVKARIIKRAQNKLNAVANNGGDNAAQRELDRRGRIGSALNNDSRLRSIISRNKRSVWTINTLPYAGAHFATMPEKLVEPCILAGSKAGDIVLDPFLGSGTVGAVAERLGRRWVGCDLNPAYHDLAQERTAQRGLMFGEETA